MWSEKGSPPRVRGKHFAHFGADGRRGITPACAGKTACRSREGGITGDHPRVCGENVFKEQESKELEGSPPRVRGKLFSTASSPSQSGITPACAGKTFCVRFRQAVPRDHPRVCGENIGINKAYRASKGSPPRVRGKPKWSQKKKVAAGITPACAGKTCLHMRFGMTMRDHPRVCGENTSEMAYFRG